MPSEKKVSDGIGAEARTTRACVPHTPYAWVLDFMQATACLAATRYHPKIKAFYQRLHGEKHKPAKVALNACMHKLLRILNAKVRDYLNSEDVSSLKCA